MMKKMLLLFLALLSYIDTNAHTIWLETSQVGKRGKSHEVKIYFGEPDEPTFTEKWFSDLRELQVKLVSPSGKEEILTKTQLESHFKAVFTPSEKGIYTLSVNHLVKDVFKGMKITYQSVALVSVGDKSTEQVQLGALPLQLSLSGQLPKVGGEKVFKFLKEGKTAEKERVNITSQNGWSRSYRTSNKGEIKFKPLWKGKYLVEFSWSKKEEGTHHNTPYTTDYQTINYLIEIK